MHWSWIIFFYGIPGTDKNWHPCNDFANWKVNELADPADFYIDYYYQTYGTLLGKESGRKKPTNGIYLNAACCTRMLLVHKTQ